MRSLPLSESVLSSHLLHKPPRLHPFFFPSSEKQIPRFPSRNLSSVSCRFKREGTGISVEDRFRCVVSAASPILDDSEIRYSGCGKQEGCDESYKLPEERAVGIPRFSLLDFATYSNISGSSLLKFSTLFGFLALQGSERAFASSDIAIGLQSLPFLGDLGDISTGFASAFLLIFFSELGDKTFFIAAILAARNSAAVVFAGTFGALAAMTVVSVVLGRTFHYVDEILPFRFGGTDLPVDDIAAVCLLVYFGVSTLLDATSNDGLKAEDEQKEAELAVSKFSGDGAGILGAANTVISTFALVFVAEWGDKSFFSTIALAAAASPLGVIAGALAGHGVATLLAVLGGSLLGTFLSEKAISYIGGVLFLVFAVITLFEIVS